VNRRLHWIAHIGYASRGLLFLSIGMLALLAATGSHRQTIDAPGILQVLGLSFGRLLLAVLVPGLICFSVWRILQAFWDIDGLGDKLAASGKRIAFAFNGIFYSLVALWTLWVLFGSFGHQDEDALLRNWTFWVLHLPFGAWFLAFAGMTIAGAGVGLGIRVWTAPLDQRLVVQQKTKIWLRPMTRYALAARAVIFVLMGGSFIFAAIDFDAREAKGLGSTFVALREQFYGGFWLGIVAFGFIAYGCYEFAQSFWHRGNSR
jgi:Domain of Unknown Function (DUF1206)